MTGSATRASPTISATAPRRKTPIGQSALVRQAFDMSIDRDALMQVVYNGMFPPPPRPCRRRARSTTRRSSPCPRRGPRQGAAEAGRREAAGAGRPDRPQQPRHPADGRGDPVHGGGGRVRREDHRDGVRLLAGQRAAGGFQAYLLAWSGRIDPDGNLYVFLHSAGGTQNYGHYASPAMDKLLDDARAGAGPGQAQGAVQPGGRADAAGPADLLHLHRRATSPGSRPRSAASSRWRTA